MRVVVLVNDSVKRHLLQLSKERRQQLRKVFEFLECGLWDGGLRVKKLKQLSGKVVFEGRVSRGDRLLFTLGHPLRDPETLLVYVWAIAEHDAVVREARRIEPELAPFLHFTPYHVEEHRDADFTAFREDYRTQEPIEARVTYESGPQRWFVLTEDEWRHLLLYEAGEFEPYLYLTEEQRSLLPRRPPLLIAGTAGSGKTTLTVYYLCSPWLHGRRKLYVTYHPYLSRFARHLYEGLCRATGYVDPVPPEFVTFVDLCRRWVPDAERRFPPDREVDVFRFVRFFRGYPDAERYDPILVWEEIRAIIKGAKPQFNLDRWKEALSALGRGSGDPETLQTIQAYLLALPNTRVFPKVEPVFQRLLGLAWSEAIRRLSELYQREPERLLRALHTIGQEVARAAAEFDQPLLTWAEYERLSRKRAPLFAADRKAIYAIAAWYQDALERRQAWDEIDLTRAALAALDRTARETDLYDFVVCDEVQDLTEIQLTFLFRLARNPAHIVLTGDTKQSINPSGFRWEEVRRLFYERGLAVPEIHYLSLNFRNTGSIVQLANTLLRLKQERVGVTHDERPDEWKFQGHPPFVLENVQETDLLAHLRAFAADQTILTRTTDERDLLRQTLKTERIFTIREAKGLEFHTVVLWKFCSDPTLQTLWRQILQGDPESLRRLHHAYIQHEINLLYVGITRARHDLIVYDGPEGAPIWRWPPVRDIVFVTTDLHVFDTRWRRTSSPEDWKRQGDYFMDHGHYRAAAECYRNAQLPQAMHRALALDAERREDWRVAAEHWTSIEAWPSAAACLERAGDYGGALEIWTRLGDEERAMACRTALLEQQGRFDELARWAEERHDWSRAAQYWQRAGHWEAAARAAERAGDPATAAQAYERAGRYAQAALCYEQAGRLADAGRCYEIAHAYTDALRVWRQVGTDKDCLRCLQRINDPYLFGQYYEEKKEWLRAYESYDKARTPERMRAWESDIARRPPKVRAHGPYALRLTLLKKYAEAAPLWERLREYRLAALCYEKSQQFTKAARLYLKTQDTPRALMAWARALPTDERQAPEFLRTLRRWAQSMPDPSPELNRLAQQMEKAGLDYGAALCYQENERPLEAIDCLLRADRVLEAARLYAGKTIQMYQHGMYVYQFLEAAWPRVRDMETGLLCLAYLSDVLPTIVSRPDYTPIPQAVATQCEQWLKTPLPAHLREPAHTVFQRLYAMFKLDTQIEICETQGWPDILRNVLELRMPYDEALRRRLQQEAEALARQGQWERAGVRFLALGMSKQARECFRHVPVTPYNKYCLVLAGFERRALPMFSPNELASLLEQIYHQQGPKRAYQFCVRTKYLAEGARFFARRRQYKYAIELYERAGESKQAQRLRARLAPRWVRSSKPASGPTT